MNTDEYQQFLRESRDTIAKWILDPEQAGLFARDLEAANGVFKEYRAALEAHEKSEDKRERKYAKTAAARRHAVEVGEWNRRWEVHTEWQKNQILGVRCPEPERPGPEPTPLFSRKSFEGVDPSAKFDLPIEEEALTITDWRVFLGALHDGFDWAEGERGPVICRHLMVMGTIVDELYWKKIKGDPHYQPWIKKALYLVERDIEGGKRKNEQRRKGGQGENQEQRLEPLTANAAAVYELLKDWPAHEGLKGWEILEKLEQKKPPIFIDQSTLTKNIIPALRPYGVKNKRGAGYFISK